MCAVSFVTDHFRDKWPIPPRSPSIPYPFEPYPPITPPSPVGPTIPIQFPPAPAPKPAPTPAPQIDPSTIRFTITLEQWNEYQALKKKAEEYDKRTNQPNCAKEGVAEWEEAIKAYLIKTGLLTPDGKVRGVIYNG